nr:NEDD8-conjugating enzyme Ubc12 [Ipomoea batatas]
MSELVFVGPYEDPSIQMQQLCCGGTTKVVVNQMLDEHGWRYLEQTFFLSWCILRARKCCCCDSVEMLTSEFANSDSRDFSSSSLHSRGPISVGPEEELCTASVNRFGRPTPIENCLPETVPLPVVLAQGAPGLVTATPLVEGAHRLLRSYGVHFCGWMCRELFHSLDSSGKWEVRLLVHKREREVYHPNIDLEGNVCLNILREDWKPVLNINTVIYGLYHLFTDPNHEDPLNSDAAAVLRDNPKLFESNVRRAMAGGYVGQTFFPSCA